MAIRHWIWLSALSGLSVKARAALLAHYGDAERVWLAPDEELKGIPGVSEREAELLREHELRTADAILARCDAEGIGVLTMQDARYPNRLQQIYAPPAVLYVRGALPDVDAIPSAAVIGTRSATPYGLKMARDIAWEIARCGGIVVSGLTEGVDRAAAEGCLLAGGVCIGVLGMGHGQENALCRDVAASGALVSEYPPGTPPLRFHFRERNRISAGLSHAVCVVEAPEKSGSLLFAREALEQGREIFAVPGNADAVNSAGILTLLKQGARPAGCGWDVMEDFAAIYPGTVRRPDSRPAPSEPAPPELRESALKPTPPVVLRPKEPKKEIDKKKTEGYIDAQKKPVELSEEQQRIVQAIGQGELAVDDVIEATGLSAARVLSQLTVLELRHVIVRVPGRRVKRNLSG